jgi:hypothetical protein
VIEKITLDMLTERSVSVKKQRYYNDNGTLYPIGQPHRKAYVNSIFGRQEVRAELPQEYQNAIFAIWGNEPTILEEDF